VLETSASLNQVSDAALYRKITVLLLSFCVAVNRKIGYLGQEVTDRENENFNKGKNKVKLK